MAILKITLDTNCIISAFDKEHTTAVSAEYIERLFALSQIGEIEIAATKAYPVVPSNQDVESA